jgi:hypothetical protein
MSEPMAVIEISWREAEQLAQERIDRRRKYARDGRQLFELCQFTSSCSGCFEGGEYGGMAHHYDWDKKARCHVGSGCHECGYTGKSRQSHWVPFIPVKWHADIK